MEIKQHLAGFTPGSPGRGGLVINDLSFLEETPGERWDLHSSTTSPSLGEPKSWEQRWHLRWLWQVTPQLPPSTPSLLVVVTGDIPGGTGKSSFHILRRCRENENPNFFSLGEVPGSGRATLQCPHVSPATKPPPRGVLLESHSAGTTFSGTFPGWRSPESTFQARL